MIEINRIRKGPWMCLLYHRWQCKRIERISTVRYVNKCRRCGLQEVSLDPNLFAKHVVEFSRAGQKRGEYQWQRKVGGVA